MGGRTCRKGEMAITSSFDPYSAEIITAEQMVRPVEGFPETMVVTFQPRTFAVLLEQYDTTPLADLYLEEEADSASPVQVGRTYAFQYGGCTLAGCLAPIGAPSTVAVMEKAIAHGVKRFVVFGTCGTLTEVEPGALIVPSSAYRDEGTSYHYAHASDYIPISTAGTTAGILSDLGVPHVVGKVWTTDAFYRETQVNMAKRVAEGCVAVDMEVSACAALAQFRSVSVHHFLYAADSLSDKQWDPRTLGSLPAEPRARYLRIAMEIAVRL